MGKKGEPSGKCFYRETGLGFVDRERERGFHLCTQFHNNHTRVLSSKPVLAFKLETTVQMQMCTNWSASKYLKSSKVPKGYFARDGKIF
jgi:hypothetical protein